MGKSIYIAGFLGIAIVVGICAGFYAADRGIRWMPTMLEVILIICIISLLGIMGGRILQGDALKETDKGRRLRKRIITCIVLLGIVIIARLAVYASQEPCPLTKMSTEEFDKTFQDDLQQYWQFDKGLDDQLNMLETIAAEFKDQPDRVLTPDEEQVVRDIWQSINDYTIAMEQIHVFYRDWFRFDSSRTQRSYHLRSFLLCYAADLSLFENSMRLITLVEGNDNAIKFLNAADPKGNYPADTFSNYREHFQGIDDGSRIVAGKAYLFSMEKTLRGKSTADSLGCARLWNKAEEKMAEIEATGVIEMTSLSVDNAKATLAKAVEKVWFPAQKSVATMMGNTRVRRVGKYLITEQLRERMDKSLEPGDILLSRKNWYLSNVGLPGFWPHAILYIGAKDKFDSYFDVEQVRDYLKELTGKDITLSQYLAEKYPGKSLRYSSGSTDPYRVIEAISAGVVLNTLKGACGDYMAAVRPNLDKKAKAQAIIEAFSHIDKPYDYNFDFATDDALVCTELVWRSYRPAQGKEGLEFELVSVAGRKTLPANEIAKIFVSENGNNDRQMEFVCFIDANEENERTFIADEDAFLNSVERQKWSFALD